MCDRFAAPSVLEVSDAVQRQHHCAGLERRGPRRSHHGGLHVDRSRWPASGRAQTGRGHPRRHVERFPQPDDTRDVLVCGRPRSATEPELVHLSVDPGDPAHRERDWLALPQRSFHYRASHRPNRGHPGTRGADRSSGAGRSDRHAAHDVGKHYDHRVDPRGRRCRRRVDRHGDGHRSAGRSDVHVLRDARADSERQPAGCRRALRHPARRPVAHLQRRPPAPGLQPPCSTPSRA
jgi:hypothetical protein